MTNETLELERLAQLWQERDPMPPGLSERVLLAMAVDDMDAEYELLALTHRTHELEGARSAVESSVTMSFGDEVYSMLLRVSTVADQRQIDGWVAPPCNVSVGLRYPGSAPGRDLVTETDQSGRFAFARVPAGLVRIVLEVTKVSSTPVPSDSTQPPTTASLFTTPLVEI